MAGFFQPSFFQTSFFQTGPPGVTIVDTKTTFNGSDGSSLVIAKPTGLAVGHVLLAMVCINRHSAAGLNTPSGWTHIDPLDGVSFSDIATYANVACFSKTADAGDVAASDFTFTADTAGYRLGGALMAFSGAGAVESAARARIGGGSSPVTISGGVSVAGANRLLVVCGNYQGGDGVSAIATPALATDNPFWTTTVGATALSANKVAVHTAVRSAGTATGNITQAVTFSGGLYGLLGVVTVSPSPTGGGGGGTVPLSANGNIALAGSADILGFSAVIGIDASGTIELAGSADIFGFSAVVGMDASGSISLAGSASIVLNLAFLEADGTISLEGEYADLCQWEPMVAVGTIALCGEAWLSDALHGDDTLQAIGTIMLRCRAVRLSTGEVLPPTDDLGWTEP